MEMSITMHKGIPRLDALPEELVSNISYRLDCDDISSLRLTCKALEAGSFFLFGREYFARKAFLLTSESLHVLNGIANSERLRHQLKAVYLLVGYLSAHAIDEHICGFTPTTRNREAYLTYAADQANLKETHEDLLKISEAFRRLPSLKVLTLCDAAERVPGNVDIAGYRKLGRRTSTTPAFDLGFFSHAWRTLLSAVAASGTNTVASINTLTHPSHGLSVSRDLTFPKSERESSRKALGSLKALSLNVRSHLVLKEHGPDAQASSARLSKFANVLPPIHSLDLTWDGAPSSGMLCSRFVCGLDTSLLTSLCLDTLMLTVEELSTMLKACSLLRFRIVMADMTGSWVSILQILQKMQSLEHLDLMYLREGHQKVFFLAQKEPEMDDEEVEVPDFFSFLGGPQGPTGEGSGSEPNSGFDEEDNDEPPAVEPAQVFANAGMHTHAQASVEGLMEGLPDEIVGENGAANFLQNNADDREWGQNEAKPADDEQDFKAPGMEDEADRGYYVCVKSKDEIAKWLPIFIEQYNLGEAGLPNAPPGVVGIPLPLGLGGPNAGQAAGQNGALGAQLLNSLMSLTGGLPPIPVPAGIGQGAGGQAAAQNANGQGLAAGTTQGNGAAQPFGSYPPAFLQSFNAGPGTSVTIGGFPIGQALLNPPTPQGPAPALNQNAGEHVTEPSAATATTSTDFVSASAVPSTGSGSQALGQNATSIQDFAVTGSSGQAGTQNETTNPGGVAIPDPWMLEDEEAIYSEDEVD